MKEKDGIFFIFAIVAFYCAIRQLQEHSISYDPNPTYSDRIQNFLIFGISQTYIIFNVANYFHM